MAGDWMKIELELPDKPEVHAIANSLNIDPDAVVGKLVRVWQWFDKHTINGNAYGVTYSLLDRITSVTGFGEAMMFVGWIEQNDKVLTMPKFDRHTSSSAKSRALTGKRVEKSRNGDSVTKTLPEKRREEKNNNTIVMLNTSRFVEFWNAYPKSQRKVGKTACEKKWKAKNLDINASKIISHVNAIKQTQQWKDGFEPSPLTYINQERWNDEIVNEKNNEVPDWKRGML